MSSFSEAVSQKKRLSRGSTSSFFSHEDREFAAEIPVSRLLVR